MKLLALVALFLAVIAMADAWKMDQQIYITGSFLHAKEELVIKPVALEDINCDDEAPGTIFVTEKVIDVAASTYWSRGDQVNYPSTFENYLYPTGRPALDTFVEHGIAICDGSSAVPQTAGDKRVEKYVVTVGTVDLPPIRENDDITVEQYEQFVRRDMQMRNKARYMCRTEFGPDYDVGSNFELLAYVASNGPAEDWSLPIVGRRPGVLAFTKENSVTFQSFPVRLRNEFDASCPNPMQDGDWLEFAEPYEVLFHTNNVESIAFDLADGTGFENSYTCNNLYCSVACRAGNTDFPLDGNFDRHYDFYVPGFAQENNPTESRTVIYPNKAPVFCVHKRAPVRSADFSEYADFTSEYSQDDYAEDSHTVCGQKGVGLVNPLSTGRFSHYEKDSDVEDPFFSSLVSSFGWITARAEPKKFYYQYFNSISGSSPRGPFVGGSSTQYECTADTPPSWNQQTSRTGECDSSYEGEYHFANVGCTTASPFDANYDAILD